MSEKRQKAPRESSTRHAEIWYLGGGAGRGGISCFLPRLLHGAPLLLGEAVVLLSIVCSCDEASDNAYTACQLQERWLWIVRVKAGWC